MKCPSCKYETKASVCPKCGMDLELASRASKLAAAYVLKGLSQAKDDDLSGAVMTLRKAVSIDKNCRDARNVLGLVYAQLGRFGEALREWIISYNIKQTDNPANDYIEQIKRNYRILEKMTEAVKLYNNSLTKLNHTSDDIAVIQLKRALDINPNFVDAYILLGLCHLRDGQYSKAATPLQKALEIDRYNQSALRYLRETGAERPRMSVQHTSTAIQKQPFNPDLARGINAGFRLKLSHLVFLVAGAVIAFSLYHFAFLDSQLNAQTTENDAKIAEIQATYDELKAEHTTLSTNYETLESDKAIVDAQLSDLQNQVALNVKIEAIDRVQMLIDAESYEEAGSLLQDLDTQGLDTQYLQRVSDMKADVFPRLEQLYFTQGEIAWNSNRDTAALEQNMNLARQYSAADSELADAITYFIGRVYQEQQDFTRARENYQAVIDSGKDPEYSAYAQTRLTEME